MYYIYRWRNDTEGWKLFTAVRSVAAAFWAVRCLERDGSTAEFLAW